MNKSLSIETDTKAHPDQVAHRGYSTPPHPCLAVHVDALLPLLVEVNDLQPRPDVGEGGRVKVHGAEPVLFHSVIGPILDTRGRSQDRRC